MIEKSFIHSCRICIKKLQQQLCYASSSYAMAAAIMLWQQHLCYGNSIYTNIGAAMLWQQQLCYGRSSYAMTATAEMLWHKHLCYGSSSIYSKQKQICYGSNSYTTATGAMPWQIQLFYDSIRSYNMAATAVMWQQLQLCYDNSMGMLWRLWQIIVVLFAHNWKQDDWSMSCPACMQNYSVQQRKIKGKICNVQNNRFFEWQPGHKNNCRFVYFVWILTCCIIFQFEASASELKIRMKMNEEVVAWRDLARWQRITTIWICQHGWCIWTTIKNCQWITTEIKRM